MTDDSHPPILDHALARPSAFTAKNLIDDVRRNRQIPNANVPPVMDTCFSKRSKLEMILSGLIINRPMLVATHLHIFVDRHRAPD